MWYEKSPLLKASLFDIFSESVPQIPVTLAVSSMDSKVQCTWLFLAHTEAFFADWRVFLNPQSTESDMKSRTGQAPQARFSSSRLSGNRQDFFPSICSYWSASVWHPPVNHTLYSREIHLGKIETVWIISVGVLNLDQYCFCNPLTLIYYDKGTSALRSVSQIQDKNVGLGLRIIESQSQPRGG